LGQPGAGAAAELAPAWTNWSGSVTSRPRRIVAPRSEDELAAVVAESARRGETVRVAGSGHSFVPLCAAEAGTVISLEHLKGVVAAEAGAFEATVWAGSKIFELGEPLRAGGLAMTTMGDIDRQAIAGAIATGTHGTGYQVPSIPNQVVGLRLVTADGGVRELALASDPDAMRAARVSLGALGVVSQVRLRLVPSFRLQERTWFEAPDECMARLEERIHATRHFEFFWMPVRDACFMKTLHPTSRDPEPTREVTIAAPAAGAGSGKPARAAKGDPPSWRERVDWSDRVFPSERNVKFNEIEFSLAEEQGPPCFAELRALMLGRYRGTVEWPLEYRTVAPDDIYLSPMHGRHTVSISAHQAAELPHQDFFRDVEAIFRAHGARPHWGKMHTHRAAELRALYPRWEDFQRVRRAMDPQGVFLNQHLRDVLDG
jgi:FAD/FMN-containing dehydrogenase